SAFAGSSAVQVRFTFASDRTVVREGWYVDDIRIEETVADCSPDDDFVPTTTTTTTTTTLPEPPRPCASDVECDDGVRCTKDSCLAGTCRHAALVGAPALECRVADALGAPLCGDEKVDPRLENYVRARLEKARGLLATAGKHLTSSA